ncbi:MAG: hypothetical protein ACMXYC_03440 [Candidatus Woesearchaeota archaeon]
MSKKGQAALEFLTTYGWAFLVILIMIGALAYFGVLNPQRFISDKCVATTGFSCAETGFNNGDFQFVFVNGLGGNVSNATWDGTGGCQLSADINGTYRANERKTINISNCDGASGTRVEGIIDFNYIRLGSELQNSGQVEIGFRQP